MADRSPARIIAPLALVLVIVGVLVVVQASRSRTLGAQPAPAHATTSRRHPAKPKSHFYVVKVGDNLTVISSRTGVTIESIERLNPSVDPQALHAGERLRIAR